MVMQAYVGGIYTRKPDALVAALGVQNDITRAQKRRFCGGIDVQVRYSRKDPWKKAATAYVYLVPPTYRSPGQGSAGQLQGRSGGRGSMLTAAVSGSTSRWITVGLPLFGGQTTGLHGC